MKNKNIIIGAGGHAKVIQHELSKMAQTFFLSTDPQQQNDQILLEKEQDIGYLQKSHNFYFGIGGVDFKSMQARKSIYNTYAKTIDFKSFVSSQTLIDPQQLSSKGCVIMKAAVVQYNVRLGDNLILNTGCVVEHDASIGSHSHIGPGATLCGDVQIGESCLIGAGSTVIQGLSIGNNSILAAGSVLTENMPADEVWAGAPARKIKNTKEAI